ncbi:MAG: hypothetical protein ACYCW6_31865 [Candidatus Xenobia bacterium]
MSYLLIRVADVHEDVYPWKPEELLQFGTAAHAGKVMHRVKVRTGTVVHGVEVTLHRLGQTIAAPNGRSNAVGQCHYASDCYPKCCSVQSDGNCYCNSCCIADRESRA